MKYALTLAAVLSIANVDAAAGGIGPCVGDCNQDGAVAVYETVTGISIALGNAELSVCRGFDRNGDGAVDIEELIAGVGSMLDGCTPGSSLRLEAVGGEFRASAGTEGFRRQSQVAMEAEGGFIVIWGDTVTEEDNFGLAGRRFLSDGMPATPLDFAVNIFTLDVQRTQDVAMRADGAALAVWETSGIILEDDDVRAGIYGRRFDTGGVGLGPDFKINTNDVDDIREDQPVAAALADDTYIVAWTFRENVIGGQVGVSARRVDATGLPVGEEFAVTEYVGFQDHPAIAPLPDGGFVVVWQDGYRDGLSAGIFGQRFDADAGRVGTEFLVNTYTFGQQRLPSIATDSEGGFLVTWAGILVGDEQIIARRFDSAGEPVGTEFEVNPFGQLGQQSYPSVASAIDDGFVVVWMSGGSIGRFNIVGQRLDRNGNKVGQDFQVNTFTSTMFDRAFPEIASNEAGEFVVVWEDQGSTYDVTIRGQRYRLVEE